MSVPVQATPQPAASVPRQDRRGHAWLAVAAPTGLAAVLSLYQVTSRSLGFDEGATVAIASQHGAGLWSAIAHDGGNMSVYYLLIHLLISAFGNGLLVVRLPSMVAFVATVALIGVIGNRLFHPLVSLVAGLLATVSLPLVYWAQTARGYAPMVAFVCAAYVAVIALADPRAGKPPRRWPWLAYVLAMTLAMYCSFVAILVVPAQLLVVVRRRASLLRLGSALAVTAVCCIPLAILAVRRGSGQLFWVPRPTRMVESQVLQSLTSAGLAPTFHKHATTYVLMWATVVAIVALVLDTIRRRRRGEAVWGIATVLAWCVVPAGLTFLYSLVSQPIFVPRNLVMSTPAVALALAVGLSEVARRGEVAGVGAMRLRRAARRPAAIAGTALVAVLALRAVAVAAGYGVSPEPWKTVTAHVISQSRPGDCIAFYPQDARMAFQYYVGSEAEAIARSPRSILPVIRWRRVKPYVEDYVTLTPAQIAQRSAGCRRMWFVSSHEGQANGPARSRAHRAQWFRLRGALERVFGWAPVEKFGYASTIHVQLLPGRER